MKIEYRKVEDLIPYINNPRKNDQAVSAVADSIKQFGFKVPITIDKEGVVATGHTRLKAALKLELEEVPVIVLDDLSPDQVKAFRLVDNKTGELAEWDFNALALELEDIQMDISQFSFDMPEFENPVEEDNFEINLPKKPTTKYGEVYKLGRHRLMCGDGTKEEDVHKLMSGRTADLVIIDPPYNVDYESAAGKIMNDKQESAQFLEFLVGLFSAANRVLKKGGGFYIWHSESEGFNFREACRRVGWEVRQCLIWNKNAFVLGRQDYQWKHEPCLYGWKEGAAHYFVNDRTFTTVQEEGIDINKLKLSEAKDLLKQFMSSKEPVTVIEENKPVRSEEHPTMKPVRLIGRLITNSSRPNEIVLDTVAGSGSVMAAAEQLNRKAYMMELDPQYADAIIKRYETLTGDKAELIYEAEELVI